jgi:UDP-xylose/UDP-N-acetylglucosamine transporter B4
MNALTQYLCIRGVHLLSAKSSSLTVTIFLNIRKLVSLLLSIYLFGNHLAGGVLVGAALVFVGGGLYGFEGARLRSATKKNQ